MADWIIVALLVVIVLLLGMIYGRVAELLDLLNAIRQRGLGW